MNNKYRILRQINIISGSGISLILITCTACTMNNTITGTWQGSATKTIEVTHYDSALFGDRYVLSENQTDSTLHFNHVEAVFLGERSNNSFRINGLDKYFSGNYFAYQDKFELNNGRATSSEIPIKRMDDSLQTTVVHSFNDDFSKEDYELTGDSLILRFSLNPFDSKGDRYLLRMRRLK